MRINISGMILFVLIISMVGFLIFPSARDVGIMYRKSYMIEDALQQLEIYYKENPGSRKTMENLVEVYGQQGLPAKQKQILHKLIKQYPVLTRYRDQLLDIYSWEGNYKAMAPLLQKMYGENPESEEYYQKLKAIYSYLQQYGKLMQLLEHRKKIAGDSFYDERDLVFVYARLKRYDKIEELYEREILEQPKKFESYGKLIKFYVVSNRRSEIEGVIARYLSEDTTEVAYQYTSGFLSWNNLERNSLNVLVEMRDKYPKQDSIMLFIARRLVDYGDKAGAIRHFNSYLSENNTKHRVRFEMAEVYESMGMYESTIREYEYVNKKRPDLLRSYVELDKRYRWYDKEELVGSLLEKMLIHVNLKKKARIKFITVLAEHYRDYGEPDKAISKYTELIKYDKNNPDHYQSLIVLYEQMENYHSAHLTREHMAENVIEHTNDSTLVALAESYIYDSAKRLKAIPYLEKILDRDSTNIAAIEMLQNVYLWDGKIEKALEFTGGLEKIGNMGYKVFKAAGEFFYWKSEYNLSAKYFSMVPDSLLSITQIYYRALCHKKNGVIEWATRDFEKIFAALHSKVEKTQGETDLFVRTALELQKLVFIPVALSKVKKVDKSIQILYKDVLETFMEKGLYDSAVNIALMYRSQNGGATAEIIEVITPYADELLDDGRWDIHFQLQALTG